MLTLLLALSLTDAAHATEVGTYKKLGLGVATGLPYVSLTGKIYLTDEAGFAGYVGTEFEAHYVRVAYQREFKELQNWDWSRLDMYWQLGLDAGIQTQNFGYVGGYLMPYGGLGAELQFHEVPAQVFLELGLGPSVLNTYCHAAGKVNDGLCWVDVNGAFGGRWYF